MIGRLYAATILIPVFVVSGCRSEQGHALNTDPGSNERTALNNGQADGSAETQRATSDARRLWAGEYTDFYASAISPDGRWVTVVDWTTGDLAVRDVITGGLHRLTDTGPPEASVDYAQSAKFSRDGRRIAYRWYDAAASDYEIHVLDFVVGDDGTPRGSGARVVYDTDVPQPASRLFDWLSEDEVLIGLYRPDNSTALARLSVSTGSLQVLKSFEWERDPGHAVVSPDGRFIVYDQPGDAGDAGMDLHLLSADGRSDRILLESPGDDVPLGWLTDGSLLVHSRLSGQGAVRRLPMTDGRPAGAAVLVHEGVLDPQPLGVAAGALHYGLVVESPAYVTATIDFEGHQLRSLPTRFEAPGTGRIVGLTWSPDGQHVVYRVNDASAGTRIQLGTADGRVIREWKLELWPMRTSFAWVTDGEGVLLPARDPLERPGYIRIDLETGEETMARRFDRGGEMGKVIATSPDGGTLYYTRHAVRDGVLDESFADLVAHDLASGRERPLRRVHGHAQVSVSPDGYWVALATGTRGDGDAIRTTLQVVSTDGAEIRTVYRAAGGDPIVPLDPDAPPVGDVLFCQCRIVGWSPDSRSILFIDPVPGDGPADAELLSVPVDRAAVLSIATIPDYDGGATLHPDGHTIAYRTGRWRGEIWALDRSSASGGTASRVPDGGRP